MSSIPVLRRGQRVPRGGRLVQRGVKLAAYWFAMPLPMRVARVVKHLGLGVLAPGHGDREDHNVLVGHA
jgi:hypothetical protein